MELGGEIHWTDRTEAHADTRVGQIAEAIHQSRQFERILLYAVTALTYRARPDSFLSQKKRGLGAVDLAAATLVDQIGSEWRRDLDDKKFGHRRGAVIERLVVLLVCSRMPASHVHEERKVKLSNGEATAPFDVLAAPAGTTWEGIECKAGIALDANQSADLCWAARTASKIGDPLMVIVASAADRKSLLAMLRATLQNPELVYFVAADTFRTLAKPAPRYAVASAS
jgi:hypothetical protein